MEKHEFVEVRGKVVDEIIIFEDQDCGHQMDIRFQDKTGFVINLESKLVIESVELRDWKREKAH
jgi:hypothetical protein